MKTYGTRPQDLLKEGLITEAEYDLKLALEENKELKDKLDAVVGYLQTLIDAITAQNEDGLDRFDWMVKQAKHIDKELQALAQAQKGK